MPANFMETARSIHRMPDSCVVPEIEMFIRLRRTHVLACTLRFQFSVRLALEHELKLRAVSNVRAGVEISDRE